MRAEIFSQLRRHLEAEELVALATVVAGPGAGEQMLLRPGGRIVGGRASDELAAGVLPHAEAALESFAPRRLSLATAGGQIDLFLEVFAPLPRLVIVGAVHVAIHLIRFARQLGFHTVVVDPRTAFATPERFAEADELILEWPDKAFARLPVNEATHFVFLSHDLKIDLPGLEIALAGPARYVGALGSKKTHAKRVAALRERGATDEMIERIHAPIGLDLGGRRAVEIALAIIAQIVAVDHGLLGHGG